jgi:xylan 1,4-beta-xylosidase
MHFEIRNSTPRIANNRHWQFCVGSGQARLAVRSDYTEQLKFIHAELGIKRVRFHGIFDDCMQAYMGLDDALPIPFAKNFKNYNFMNIAAAYDNVLAAGMQPWVELSFMPFRLGKQRKKKGAFNLNAANTPPKSDVEWQNFIQEFIRFLLHRYGKEEVRQWYFEVWNEPNINIFFKGSQKDYFHLYEITVKAIKSVDPELRVGGPSTALSAWLPEFIGFVHEKNIPTDFISTHHYPGDAIGKVFMPKIMFDILVGGINKLRKIGSGDALAGFQAVMGDKTEQTEMEKGQMGKATAIARKQAGDAPLYYTEWNCNAMLTSGSNDTRKVASFQVKSIIEMEPYVTGSSIWAFSDIFDEFMLVPNEFCGGFGLLTLQGIPKPQFYALKLLSQAGDRRYDLPVTNDEIEFAIYESDTQKQVFVFRNRMKNVTADPEEYDIALELPVSPKNVTLERIDENHCNPLRVWNEMGKPGRLNKDEVDDIIRKSTLVMETLPPFFENGCLKLEGRLGVNDIHCYKITS